MQSHDLSNLDAPALQEVCSGIHALAISSKATVEEKVAA
jgi:hypothetical protein